MKLYVCLLCVLAVTLMQLVEAAPSSNNNVQASQLVDRLKQLLRQRKTGANTRVRAIAALIPPSSYNRVNSSCLPPQSILPLSTSPVSLSACLISFCVRLSSVTSCFSAVLPLSSSQTFSVLSHLQASNAHVSQIYPTVYCFQDSLKDCPHKLSSVK